MISFSASPSLSRVTFCISCQDSRQNQAAVGRESSRDESYLQGTILTECTHTQSFCIKQESGEGRRCSALKSRRGGAGGSLSKSVEFEWTTDIRTATCNVQEKPKWRRQAAGKNVNWSKGSGKVFFLFPCFPLCESETFSSAPLEAIWVVKQLWQPSIGAGNRADRQI